jgi:molybdate transport system ATP-binding protein
MTTFQLSFTLRQGPFVVDIDLGVNGRAVALFGPSGSGKTSLLEAVAGLRRPQSGRIAIGTHDLFDEARRVDVPSRDRRIGYVPQDTLLFPHLDVRRNVLYGRRPGPKPPLETLIALLELEPLMDRAVATLSGGERQRVAIARALYSGPEVLLLDEPLAAVDYARRRRIVAALLRIRDDLGLPIMYVTHTVDEAVAVADTAIVLDTGRVTACGPPREVLRS